MNKPKPRKDENGHWKPKTGEDEQWLKLMNRGDRVGIRLLRAAQLKRKRKLSAVEKEFLAEFDSERKMIANDPEGAWQDGFQMAMRGIVLLESIIYERRLQKVSELEDSAAYNAVSCLFGLAIELRTSLIRHGEDGSHYACHAVFAQGKAYASAFSRLAIAYPEHFREAAERSLTMPSLRARNPGFTCDAEAIIQAIHLAEKHHASNLHDNRTRIGALCHLLVAEMVDLIEAARLEVVKRDGSSHRLRNLPSLQGNANQWWKLEIKERVQREFDRMKNNSRRNPALWEELEKLTDHGTNSAMRAAFEKYCRNKLDQIAGKPTKSD